jgi:hypothetical protein
MVRETNMPAALVEVCFICNPKEEALLKTDSFINNAAAGIAKGVMDFLGVAAKPAEPTPAKNPIMGNTAVSARAMEGFLTSRSPSPKIACSAIALAELFVSEGYAEGVRGDVAFCQSIHETGWFKYGGSVQPEQNNYAGIGAVSATVGGASFDTPQIGVRAQIQHLKAYASKDALRNPVVDPRFGLVTRGVATNWEDLNGRWAVPGTTYGQSIMKLYGELVEFAKTYVYEKSHWADEYWNYLNELGVMLTEKRYDEPMTRGEVFATLARYAQRNK